MNGRRHWMPALLAASAWVFLRSTTVFAQGDPIEIQKRAIQRIDGFIDTFRRTGDMTSRRPDLERAEGELEESNRMLAASGDWPALALGLIKRGHVHRMQGRWQQAIPFYRQAEDAAKRGQDVSRRSEALAWRALSESSLRQGGEALADATEAVRLADSIHDKDAQARALDVLGTVQLAQLDLAGAADSLNREVAVAAGAKDPMTAYFAYLSRSDVYLKTGEKCDYQRNFEQCFEALDRAGADLEQALAIAQKLGYGALARQTRQFINNIELRRGMIRSQQGMDRVVEKTALFHPKKPGDVLVSEKFVPPPAELPPLFREISEASKRSDAAAGPFASTSEARIHFVDGMMNEYRGDNDAALASYRKAVASLEADRRALSDERSRGTFLGDRINFYYAAVQQLLDRRRYGEAFEIFERSRSRALADLLASRTPSLSTPAEQKLYAESATLRTQIADAQGRLFELESRTGAKTSGSQIGALRTMIRSLDDQYQRVVARMGVEAPRLRNLVVSTPATLDALQASMRKERYELLQYLVTGTGVVVWHIAPDAVTVRNVFLPASELSNKVSALRKSLGDRNARFDEATARELFLYLIQPVLSRIGTERLVIVPHEDLQSVPFQVFQDPADGRFLGERFQITYAPSASVLLGLRRSSGLSGGRLLAVADPGIPAAGREVTAIARLFPAPARVVTETLARESDVKAWVGDYDVIHLSVHGKFDAAEPMLSYLSFARAGADDGRLTAAEMFGLPLARSRVVVLSACESGRVEATHGNEVLGMVRALLYAGAGTLVLSYWEVDSEATALWMKTFYESALTRPPEEAARAALLKVKSTPAYSHPYYWAAFGMIGR